MSTLPGELVDSILDLIHADSPSSLAACALVCQQWLPRSRYRSFAIITLTRDRNIDTVKTFLHLVASPLVTFVSSVREVRLYHRSSYGTPVLSAGDIISLLWRSGVHPTFLELDCHFTQLGMPAHHDSFASLTHLRLVLHDEVPLEKLFYYLCAFPSLQSFSLHLPGPGSTTTLHPRITPRVLPPNLHELILDEPRIIDDGLDLSRLDALRHLRLHQHFTWMANSITTLLASIRGSSTSRLLETMDVSFIFIQYMNYEKYAEFRDVDSALADSSTWPHLRRLAMFASDGNKDVDFPADARRILRANMPLCHARGILVIP
ncbi:hypothetical protein FB451DRAFT_1491132 [Mycena latifolia]|nr:hypothetical protein FB451DRAFT_1491132 [Mycena latifolia]